MANLWSLALATPLLMLLALVATPRGVERQEPARPDRARMAELWSEPERGRNLFYGIGGQALAPNPSQKFRVIAVKVGGFSDGYTVVDEAKREWSVKLPPEAATEVTASRILWAVGYHQPPVYFVPAWTASGTDRPNPQLPGRFREKEPRFHALKEEGAWSYARNPFSGSAQLNGLIVLHVMLGNSDLKDSNNSVYVLDAPVEGAARWYVSRDIGHTFGRTGVFNGIRGDVDVFEETPFIRGVADGKVEMDYRGRHRSLVENVRVGDVVWISTQLDRLTDTQWRDAFRAGGYDAETSARFIRRLKQKVADGLALASEARRPRTQQSGEPR